MALAHVLIKRIGPHHQLLDRAAYVAAFVVLCIFPSFDRRTEIEEHGLIAGYANSGFAGEWPGRLRAAVRQIEGGQDVHTALDKALLQAQLISYRMNFTTKGGQQSSLTYTVVPSSRGDAREAVVLVVATNWTTGVSRSSLGLGTGTVLAQYLKTVSWNSKDVFVVFVDSSLPYGAGARAWLRAYLGGTSAVRRGILRQAVVLDISNRATWLLCDVEGINGAVPNQDIVNSYTVGAREQLPVFHRETWDSVYHTFRNGGVHSSHAAFLELQVPAFTVRGQRSQGRKTVVNGEALARSLEGIVRCFSNNLQQLHHSFNFYFFTGANSHISNGLYLYPVFAMQLPLLSSLCTLPSYYDVRSLLVGFGSIAAAVAASGSPIFFLATEPAFGAAPPQCVSPAWGEEAVQQRRLAVSRWLASGAAGAVLVGFLLRQHAFRVYGEACGEGVRLPNPLWEAMRAASGFVFLIILAPIAIYSWAVAMPLTMLSVPLLVLVRPFSLRQRPVRSLLLLAFLGLNAALLLATPPARAKLLGGAPARGAKSVFDFYFSTVLPSVPRGARKYMPTPLVQWLFQGPLGPALQGDVLLGLYEAARDFNCVGGMLFPVFCFVYWPLLVLLMLIAYILPAQRVEDEKVSLKQIRLGVLLVVSLVLGSIVGGVVWRSYSSSGLGKLQWL